MKIAIVSSGSSIHVKKIANYLAENGNEITLYTLPNHNKLLSDFDSKIKIVKLPFSGKFGYYLNFFFLRKKLKKGNFDLLNSHFVSGYGTLCRMTNFHPSALAVFGSDVYEYPYKSRMNMKRIIKNLDYADVITSTSNVMANKVKEFYKKNKKIYITPFGVDISKFYPRTKKTNDIFTFGTVKKMEYKYGIDLLIKAYAIFLKELPSNNSKLVIYGRGTALDDFKKLAIDLKVDKFIDFKGFIKNELVPDALSSIDVAIFPSVLESFGVSAVEAMGCGVPVIASDAAGFTEVIDNGKTGLIFRKNNVVELAELMKKMYLMQPKEKKKMSKKAVERVKKMYNFNKNMEAYVDAIQHAIKK